MSRSNHPSSAQWLAHVTQWRASGLSRNAYCTEHGLKLHSLIYWIKREKPQPETPTPLTLVPAKVVSTSPKSESESETATALILECRSGYKLILPAATCANWLSALLSALA